MTRVRKTDSNQVDMMICLRKAGFVVASTHRLGGGFPDMVVGGNHRQYNCPYLVLVEVKAKGGKLTEAEEAFMTTFHAMPVVVATKPSDVAICFGWSEEDARCLDEGFAE